MGQHTEIYRKQVGIQASFMCALVCHYGHRWWFNLV